MNEQAPSVQKPAKPSKTPICFIISACALFVGLFTPKILAFLPLSVAIIFGFIALARREKLKWLATASAILSIMLLIGIQVEMNKVSEDLQKTGSNFSKSYKENSYLRNFPKEDYSYLQNLEIEKVYFHVEYGGGYATFRARVKNNGDKIVTQLKANVEVYDKHNNVIQSATIHDFGDIFPGSAKEISTMSSIPRESKSCRIFLTDVYIKR